MDLDPATRHRIEQIVQGHPVVLFMKGDREAPRCGFSATVVGWLDQLLPDYHTVDVLSDPSLREGVKAYSDWPTIPQLYVRGEFLGGCDIAGELYASRELHAALGVGSGASEPPGIEISDEASEALRQGLARAPEGSALRLRVDARQRAQLLAGAPEPGDLSVARGDLALHLDPLSAERARDAIIDVEHTGRGARLRVLLPHASGGA